MLYLLSGLTPSEDHRLNTKCYSGKHQISILKKYSVTFRRDPYALHLSNQLCLLSEERFDGKDTIAGINQICFHHTVICYSLPSSVII